MQLRLLENWLQSRLSLSVCAKTEAEDDQKEESTDNDTDDGWHWKGKITLILFSQRTEEGVVSVVNTWRGISVHTEISVSVDIWVSILKVVEESVVSVCSSIAIQTHNIGAETTDSVLVVEIRIVDSHVSEEPVVDIVSLGQCTSVTKDSVLKAIDYIGLSHKIWRVGSKCIQSGYFGPQTGMQIVEITMQHVVWGNA